MATGFTVSAWLPFVNGPGWHEGVTYVPVKTCALAAEMFCMRIVSILRLLPDHPAPISDLSFLQAGSQRYPERAHGRRTATSYPNHAFSQGCTRMSNTPRSPIVLRHRVTLRTFAAASTRSFIAHQFGYGGGSYHALIGAGEPKMQWRPGLDECRDAGHTPSLLCRD